MNTRGKNYFLDTNVLITTPDCLTDATFPDGNIFIPEVVITELEKFKKEDSARGHASRKIGRILRELGKKGDLKTGIANTFGYTIRILPKLGNGEQLLEGWDVNDPDQMILKAAHYFQTEHQEEAVIFVTGDIYLAIKADQVGLKTLEPNSSNQSDEYTGQRTVYCKQEAFAKIASTTSTDWVLSATDVYLYDEERNGCQQIADLIMNEFLIIVNEANSQAARLGRFNGREIVPLEHENERPCNVIPRGAAQRFLQEALTTKEGESRLVILEGPAGTAKTFYTLAVGAQARENDIFDRFYVIRANVEADASFGFLPGTMDEKFEGFMNPVYDNLEILQAIRNGDDLAFKFAYSSKSGEDKTGLLKEFGIEAKPLNYMRGRSLQKRLIFVDEVQNLTRQQVKMIVTRAGEGSVVVLAGDTHQIDNPKLNRFNNGLTHAITTMMGEEICWFVRLQAEDNERGLLSKIAARKM